MLSSNGFQLLQRKSHCPYTSLWHTVWSGQLDPSGFIPFSSSPSLFAPATGLLLCLEPSRSQDLCLCPPLCQHAFAPDSHRPQLKCHLLNVTFSAHLSYCSPVLTHCCTSCPTFSCFIFFSQSTTFCCIIYFLVCLLSVSFYWDICFMSAWNITDAQ